MPGGEGLARLPDGRVGFARGVAPGDRIAVHAVDERRGYLRATSWQLLEPSPERAPPPCPVADRCGGCDWMHLGRDAQLRGKAAVLREALRRTGGLRELPAALAVRAVGSDLGYRCRLRLHVDGAGRVGLFAHASHELVEIPGCPVSALEIEAVLRELRTLGAGAAAGPGIGCDLEIRVAPGGPGVSVHVLARDRPTGRPADAWLAALSDRWTVSLPGESYDPHKEQRWPLPGGVELRAPPQAFTQVNWPVNLAIVQALIEGARARGVRRFCDLYCGAGNFALALLAAGFEGVGVDRAGAGIRAAARAAREQGLERGVFVASEVAAELPRMRARGERFDLVVLDPPRTGAREILPEIVALGPAVLGMCACDPVTLARDLRALGESGYELEAIEGFDMFPHTHHVEALAWLRRQG